MYKRTKTVENIPTELLKCIVQISKSCCRMTLTRSCLPGKFTPKLVAGLLLSEAVSSCPNNKVKRANQSFINSTAIVVRHRIMKGWCHQGYLFPNTSRAAFYLCGFFKLTLFNILISIKLKFMKYEYLLRVTSITVLYLFIFYHYYYYYYYFFFFFFDGVGFVIFFFALSFNFAKRGYIPVIKISWPGVTL